MLVAQTIVVSSGIAFGHGWGRQLISPSSSLPQAKKHPPWETRRVFGAFVHPEVEKSGSGLKVLLETNLLLGAILERGFTAGTGAILQLLTGAFLFAYPLTLFQRGIAGRMLCTLAAPGFLALHHIAATASGAHAWAGTAHAATTSTAATFGHRNATSQCGNQNRNHQHILAHHVLLLMRKRIDQTTLSAYSPAQAGVFRDCVSV
jgi:hypothetical protein